MLRLGSDIRIGDQVKVPRKGHRRVMRIEKSYGVERIVHLDDRSRLVLRSYARYEVIPSKHVTKTKVEYERSRNDKYCMKSFREWLLQENFQYRFVGNKAVIIPAVHGGALQPPDKKNLQQVQTIAQYGYWYEGIGEGGQKGEGPERNFLKQIGVPQARNNGSYDDTVKLGGLAGYTLFASLHANKATVSQLSQLKGNTVKDVLFQALTNGTATFQSEKLSSQQANNVISIAQSDGLNLDQPKQNVLSVLQEGEGKMWAGGNPDGSSKSPLGNYAFQACTMRRQNVIKLANQHGGLFFMGQDHLPAFGG